MSQLPLHPHGAARVAAGLGSDPEAAPVLDEVMSAEAMRRAEVSPEDAHLAWELVRLAGGLDEPGRRAALALTLAVTDAVARGSTRVRVDTVAGRLRAMGVREATLAQAVAALGLGGEAGSLTGDALAQLLGAPERGRPLVREGDWLYVARLHAVEVRLAERVARRTAGPREGALEGRLERAIAALRSDPVSSGGSSIVLTDEQESAVGVAFSPLAAVSGGPGTGKTSIVVAILRAAVRLGIAPGQIALAAPTGKAADRMRRAVQGALRSLSSAEVGAGGAAEDRALLEGLAAPRTLHRLLGFSPRRGAFRRHEGDPLAERLVVVDESSMIDVFLMERLLAALTSDARLVLLGDAEQLPSVAAGAVFRDLGRAPGVAAVHLTRSHRMDPTQPAGFHILRVAARVNAGDPPERGHTPDTLAPLEDASPDLRELVGVAHLDPPSARARERLLDAWFEQRVRGDAGTRRLAQRTWDIEEGRVTDEDASELEPLFVHAEAARLLCITRSAARATGVDAVNASLHRRMAEALGVSTPGRFLSGEPVLMTRNDYERELFNGDQGIVLFTSTERGGPSRLAAVFRHESGFVAHPLDAVRAGLELGFATTVHKAQGSEHEQVALLLPESDTRLLTREIVYTAITRARRSVLLVGRHDLLARAVRRRIERDSGIAERVGARRVPDAPG